MKKNLLVAFLISFCLYSCSKDGGVSPQPGGGRNGGYGLSGTIIFDWATDGILKIDMNSGVKSTVSAENTALYGWDVSWDGKKILRSTEDPDDLNDNIYTYSNIRDGTVISTFKYYPNGSTDITNGYVSPNEAMVAVQPDMDNGLVILDMHGKELKNLTGFNGLTFGQTTEIAWMPDNSLIFTMGQSIYRTNTAFTQASLIKTLNFDSFSGVTVSPDGKKIAFNAGNHIWMMNSDGSGLVQVTDSDNKEKNSTFSPDSKYLLVGTDWQVTGPFGALWYLAVVPADGKKYNVNKGVDKNVIFIKDGKSANEEQACSGYMCWR